MHMEKSLAKVSGQVPGVNGQKLKLPHDIDYYVFSKVSNDSNTSFLK